MSELYYTPSAIDLHGSPESGFLAALEGGSGPVPFDIKRVFYIFGVPKGGKRGGHAHRQGQQFFVCLAGKVKIMHELGPDTYVNVLTPPPHPAVRQQSGIFMPAGHWVEIEIMEPDTVLLCLCSNYYDEADYIRDRGAWEQEFTPR